MQWMGRCTMVGLALVLLQPVPGAAQEAVERGEVSYVSGGVGADSREQLAATLDRFNLKLVFTLQEGNYVADVEVTVRDAQGRSVIEHTADGPYLLARLPAGTYEVRAVYEDEAQTHKVTVNRRLTTAYLRWASDPERDLPVSRWLEPGAS
jgi:hypothetical protein